MLLRGDCAFSFGSHGQEMYFVQSGVMQMVDAAKTVCYNTLYSGAYFGELALLTGAPLL